MSHNVERLLDAPSKPGMSYGIEQFAKGLVHTGIESPINAVLQIGSKALQSENVPKLEITGAPEKGSFAGMAGSITGAAIDFYLLNKAAAPALEKIGLNGISTGAQVGRMAITGAVYEGVLLESDPNSKNFFTDRLKAGAVGAGTFAVMGATASAVDKLGVFAVPEARTLLGSVTHGVLTGSIAGVARSEINALVKENRFASGSELLSDTTQYAMFGGVFGSLNYAQNTYANAMRQKRDSRPTSFEADRDHKVLDIKRDAEGNVVKAVIERPAYESKFYTVQETLTKMTDGRWENLGRFKGEMRSVRWLIPGVTVNQAADGTLAILRNGGRDYGNYLSLYKPNNQGFLNQKFDQAGFDPGMVKFSGANFALDNKGYREYDGNLLNKMFQKDGQGASIQYNKDGSIESVRFDEPATKKVLSFSPEKKGNGWTVSDGEYTYSWNGKISAKIEPGKPGIIEFKNADGSIQKLAPEVQVTDVMSRLRSSMNLADGPTALPVVNVDKSGKIVMTEPTRMYRPVINDEPLQGGKQEIKPGDKIIFWEDIGDRAPDVIGRILQWGKTPNGVPILDGKVLEPGSRFQLKMPTQDNHNLTDGQFYRRYRMGIKGEF